MVPFYIELDRSCPRLLSLLPPPDLFGGVSLAREWDCIDQPGILRLDLHSDTKSAYAALAPPGLWIRVKNLRSRLTR